MTLEQQDIFDFETPIDRTGTGALKLDKYAGKDVIPLWVADMDLRVAPAITAAVQERIEHGIFGYTLPTEGVQDSVMTYYKVSVQYTFELLPLEDHFPGIIQPRQLIVSSH